MYFAFSAPPLDQRGGHRTAMTFALHVGVLPRQVTFWIWDLFLSCTTSSPNAQLEELSAQEADFAVYKYVAYPEAYVLPNATHEAFSLSAAHKPPPTNRRSLILRRCSRHFALHVSACSFNNHWMLQRLISLQTRQAFLHYANEKFRPFSSISFHFTTCLILPSLPPPPPWNLLPLLSSLNYGLNDHPPFRVEVGDCD